MNTTIRERQFHAAIFQRKMEQKEIESEITRLENKFRKMDKYGDVSGWFDIQDQLGIMYNRLMRMWRRKMGK